jgi:sigma-E factor negative regulatory protein RseB
MKTGVFVSERIMHWTQGHSLLNLNVFQVLTKKANLSAVLSWVILTLPMQVLASEELNQEEPTNAQIPDEAVVKEEVEQLAKQAPTEMAETVAKVDAAYWLAKLKTALTSTNFEAGIVNLKGGKTESFQWVHGVLDSGEEVERISPLIGGGITTVRRQDTVTFFESNNEPYSLKSASIRAFIPPVFYKDATQLGDSYRFVMVSKSQIAGRSAQLIRIESKSRQAYNFWVWIDVLSGLPLRMAYVAEGGDILEQVLMTHLTMLPELTDELKKIAEVTLPEAPDTSLVNHQQTNNWQMTWMPDGFELIKSDRHHVSINREVADYYLYSDGLTELSVYVQRPLESFTSPIVLTDGATSFVMLRGPGYDVTVVGKVPPAVANKIATSVHSAQQ